jgi:hypothetical protein
MLTVEVVCTRRMTGEVRPNRSKTGRSRAAGGRFRGRDCSFAAMQAVAMPSHLPVGLESGYSAVNQERIDRLSGKCRLIILLWWGGDVR